ncbi:MFS transporter [Algihabitans sp.]|uniref:MFS transporter n=1 Tax=Algihabitans sp. TaxID=2821514 RepID=UPI003BAC159F
MLKSSHPSVYLIAIGAFSLGMASYVTAGLIPMIETSFSVSVAVAAQLVTAFTLAYGLGSPIAVALLPALRQRFNLLLALGVFIVANAASAMAEDFATLMAWRSLAGLGAGVYLAMGIPAAAALAGAEGRGKAIALIMGGMASGTVLGVPIGLLLAERLGWEAALWLIALLGCAAFIGLLFRLPPLPSGQASSLRQKVLILADRNVMSILTVSLLAAIASLGMYTFIAPFLADRVDGGIQSVTPYLWAWGVGGVCGSLLVGPLVDRHRGPAIILIIMVVLAASLLLLPVFAQVNPWLAIMPIAVWGAVGWALQVPQNNELLRAREKQGDGNLAAALNECALYLGSAIGAAAGGILFLIQMPAWTLTTAAAAVAALGALFQVTNVRKSPSRTRCQEPDPAP